MKIKRDGKDCIDYSIQITCMCCLQVKHYKDLKFSTGTTDVCYDCYPEWKKLRKKNNTRKYRQKSCEHEEWMKGEYE